MMARLLLLLVRETHAGVQSTRCLLLAVPLILLAVGVHAQDAAIQLSSAPTSTGYLGLFSSATTDDPGVPEASPTEDSWSLWTSNPMAWPTYTSVDGLDLKITASANSLIHLVLETSMEPYSLLLDVSTENSRLQHLSQDQTETPPVGIVSIVDSLTASPEGTFPQVGQTVSGYTGQSTELVWEMSSVSTVSTDSIPNSSTPTSSSSLYTLDGVTSPAFAFSSSSPVQSMTDASVVSGSASTVHAQTPSMQPTEMFAPAASSLTTAAQNIETLEVSSDGREFKLTSMLHDSLSSMLSESFTETLTGFHSSVVQSDFTSDYVLTDMHATQASSPSLMLSSSIGDISGKVQGQPTSIFLMPERSVTTDNYGETSLALATETSSVHYLFSSTTVLTSETSSEQSLQTFTSVLTSFTLTESHLQFLSGTLATQSTAALPVESRMLETLGSSMSGSSHSSELPSPAVTASETTEKVSTSATPSVLQPADWSHSLAPSATTTATLPSWETTSTSEVVITAEAPPTKSVPLFSSLETFSSNPSSIISFPFVVEESSLSDVFSSDVLVTDALPSSSFFFESSSLMGTSSNIEVVTSSLHQSSEEVPPSQTSIISKTPPISETHLVSVSPPVVDSLTILPIFSQTGAGVPISTYESLVEHTSGIEPSETLSFSAPIPVSSSQESSFAVMLSPSPALTPSSVTWQQPSEEMTVSETYYVTPTENVSIFEVTSSSSESLPYSQEIVASRSLETWPYSRDTVQSSHDGVMSTMQVSMLSLYSEVSPTGAESEITSLATRLSSVETSPFTTSSNVETSPSSAIEMSPVTTLSAESSSSTTSSSEQITVSAISFNPSTLTTIFSVETSPFTSSSVAISPFATSSLMEISPSATSATEILPFTISSAEMESSSPSHRPETEVVISTVSTESFTLSSLSEALQSRSLVETLVSEMLTSSFPDGSGGQGLSTSLFSESSSSEIVDKSTDIRLDSSDWTTLPSEVSVIHSTPADSTSFHIHSSSTEIISSSSTEIIPPSSTEAILSSRTEGILSSNTPDSSSFQISTNEVSPSTEVVTSSAEVTQASSTEAMLSSSTEAMLSSSTEAMLSSSTEAMLSSSTEGVPSSSTLDSTSFQILSTQIIQSSSAEVTPSPSTEIVVSPSTEILPSPSTEILPSPSTEILPSPSTEVIVSPSTEVIASPSTEILPSPSTEILPSPSTEILPSPSTEILPSPSTEILPSSSAEILPSPSTEILPSPSTEIPPSSSAEILPSSSTEIPPSPSTEIIASPSTEILPSPSTEVIPSSSTEILTSSTVVTQSSSTEAILPSSTEILASSSVPTTPSTTTTTTSQVVTTASTTAVPGLDFLVITVIKLQSGDNITSPQFVTNMEEGLARAYQIAFERQTAGGGARRRRSALLWQMVLVSTSGRSKRAVVGNVEITMQSVQRQTTNPSNANLTYTVSKDGQMVSGARASETLNTLLDQEVALELNRVVVTVAEPAVQPQTTGTSEDKKLWIIAAVLGPVVLVILVVLVVCLLVRHSQQRREKDQTDHNEPHLLTVKHGPGGEGDVTENQERPSSSQSNGLLKSRPRKMVYEVNPYPDVPPPEARLQKKGRRSLKKNKASAALNGALNEENHPESTKEGTLKVKKKPLKESGAAQSEELEMSPMEPALQSVENMELSASSTLPRFQAQTSFEEEEEEFRDNAEEERKKNKQRQRLKKKQEMETGMTIAPSDAHTAYERAQKEIDKVLGPRDSKSPPDVIAGSDRKRSKRRSKKGEVNLAYEQDENKPSGLQPKSALQPSESLEEVKSRIYSLLDDAFSLLSNNRANLGNRVVPSAGVQEDISRATRQDTLKNDDDNRRGQPSDKRVSEGVLPDVETTFGPKPGEMKHTPVYVDRTHGAYDPEGFVSLNPYRASEELGHIVLTDNKPSTILAPAQVKTTTTVPESEPWATPDKYSATKATRPTIRTHQQPDNTNSHKRSNSGSDKGVDSARAALHKDRQPIADSEETSDIGDPRTKSYNSIPTLRASESRTYPTYREDSLNTSNDHNMFASAPSHEGSLANASIPIHQPPTRNVGDKDEMDVISASLAPGASPKELVDSIRQELQTITGKLGSKDLSSHQTPEIGSNGKPPVRKPRKASYKTDHIPEIQW